MSNIQLSATQLLGNIPFEAVIGSPLVAAIQAQGAAAGESLRYIMSVLYGDQDSGATIGSGSEVLSVTFTYLKSQGGEQPETATITVPLLVLVPIPYINIDTMTITFKADINANSTFTSRDSDTQNESASSSFGCSFFGIKFDAQGAYSSKQSSTATAKSKYSVEYTIDVYVHATGEDMPAGTAKVLNLLSKSLNNAPGSGN